MTDSVGTENCWSNAITARGPRSGWTEPPAASSVSAWISAALGDGDDHAGQLVHRKGGDASGLFQCLGHQDGEFRSDAQLVLDEELRHLWVTDGVQ